MQLILICSMIVQCTEKTCLLLQLDIGQFAMTCFSCITFENSIILLDISVDQSKGMLGTFAPQKEPYIHALKEEITPSGALARGVYSAKLKV